MPSQDDVVWLESCEEVEVEAEGAGGRCEVGGGRREVVGRAGSWCVSPEGVSGVLFSIRAEPRLGGGSSRS